MIPYCASGIISLARTRNRHAACRVGTYVIRCCKLPAELARHVNRKVLLLVVILVLQKDSVITSPVIKKIHRARYQIAFYRETFWPK